MSERSLEILIGALRLIAAGGFTLAAARRWVPQLLPGRLPASEQLLGTALVATLLLSWTVCALGFTGFLTPALLVLSAVAIYVLTLAVTHPVQADPLLPATRARMQPYFWPLLSTLPVLWLDLLTRLPVPPVHWDALTYHLYLPARWLQEQQILHVPTVFGDNAAAFAPQNGALLYAWQMGLLGGDALCNWSQVLGGIVLAVALWRIGTAWGIGRESAALVAMTLVWLEPLRHWTYAARVDGWMLGFWLLAIHWMLTSLRSPARPALLASGLATGLAAGTKTIGLALVAPHVLILGVVLVYHRAHRQLVGFAAGVLAGGGWWYLHNLWLYGNPVFPFDLRLGPLRLAAGAYASEALRGQFYIADKLGLLERILRDWGVATCVLTAAGLLALAWGASRRWPFRREVAVVLGVAVYWTAFYFFWLPHNSITRFFLPVLVLSLLGSMLVLDRIHRRSPAWARVAWFAVILLLAAAARPDLEWRATFAGLAEAGADLGLWVVVATLTCVGLGTYLGVRGSGARRVVAGLTALMFGATLVMAQSQEERSRDVFYSRSRFARWAPAFRFMDEQKFPRDMRIAYTGLNLPYPLMGPGLQHRVVYCNTQGGPRDGFYEFWAVGRRLHPSHKPGLYRGYDSYEAWRANLDAEQIDLVVIFSLHFAERRYIRSTEDGFPIERTWARGHPERFELRKRGTHFEVYRVLRPEGRAQAATRSSNVEHHPRGECRLTRSDSLAWLA